MEEYIKAIIAGIIIGQMIGISRIDEYLVNKVSSCINYINVYMLKKEEY